MSTLTTPSHFIYTSPSPHSPSHIHSLRSHLYPPSLQIQHHSPVLPFFSSLLAMKQLIRRLSRVADSSQYSLLRSESRSGAAAACGGGSRFVRRRGESFRRAAAGAKAVPEGHVPVYVGEEMERFVVSAELLNHPVFIGLLNKSAQEYGYEQRGVLRIPCHVLLFERVMEALRLGLESRDLEDLLNSLFEDEYL